MRKDVREFIRRLEAARRTHSLRHSRPVTSPISNADFKH
jgi:hypothetical protein